MSELSEFVVLVNKSDSEVGIEEKIEAHRKGKLHRAFSVFVFNLQGENPPKKSSK
jgi:isopentenyl-diphosphate delta-isomerase